MKKAGKVLALGFLGLIIVAAIMGSGVAPGAYNLIENNGTPITKRSILNFVSGVTCVDNSGNMSSDCTGSGSGGTPNPTVSFTSQTSVTFTHNLNTTTPIIMCYNAASTPAWFLPNSILSTSVNVSTLGFSASQSGTCAANATGGGSGGGSLSWTAFTLGNSWGFPANGGPTGGVITGGRYAIDSFNVVHLDGVITEGNCAMNTVIATFPAGFRPVNQYYILIPQGTGSVMSVFILPSGAFQVSGGCAGGGNFAALNGITFPIN